VKCSAGALLEGCEPLRVMFTVWKSPPGFVWANAEASKEIDITVAASSFILVLLLLNSEAK
jgi:hypothetical protein